VLFDQSDRSENLVNEAVDESSGHVNRLLVTGGFLGFSIAMWGIGRAFQSTYIVTAILLRTRISLGLLSAVRTTTILFAYVAFAVALAICAVSLFSLPLWHARYGHLESTDADYLAARRTWKTAMILLALAAVVVLFIVILFWFFPLVLFS